MSRVFLDGTGITPGSEKCQCGNDCDFPCWQRIGIADACESCRCPAFADDSGGSSRLCQCEGLDTGKHEPWCRYQGDT